MYMYALNEFLTNQLEVLVATTTTSWWGNTQEEASNL